MQCLNVGCEVVLKRREIPQHADKRCLFAKIECLVCKQIVVRADLKEHLYKLHLDRLAEHLAQIRRASIPAKLQLAHDSKRSIK